MEKKTTAKLDETKAAVKKTKNKDSEEGSKGRA